MGLRVLETDKHVHQVGLFKLAAYLTNCACRSCWSLCQGASLSLFSCATIDSNLFLANGGVYPFVMSECYDEGAPVGYLLILQ